LITSAICLQYKCDILKGLHQQCHVYKIALFTEEAELDKNTVSYNSQKGEVLERKNGYKTGGKELSGFSVSMKDDIAILDFNSVEWTVSSIIARGALIYNDSLPDKNTIAVVDFKSNMKSLNDSFTVKFPDSGPTTSIIRIL
jgi:hypothetical protein